MNKHKNIAEHKIRYYMADLEKYKVAYKICFETVNNPKMLSEIGDSSIPSFLSRENWLSFPVEGEISRQDVVDSARPNIYLSLEDNRLRLGLTLNQIKAVEWFFDIMESYSNQTMKEVIKALNKLPDEFQTIVARKIKDKNHQQVPKYTEEKVYKSNKITELDLKEMVTIAKKIREEGTKNRLAKEGKYYSETPEIEIAVAQMPYNEENLKKVSKLLFPILGLCLSITPRRNANIDGLKTELKKDKMLYSFKDDKKEYFDNYIKSKYPEIGFGTFTRAFNEILEDNN